MDSAFTGYLHRHRAHDPAALLERWEAVARETGLTRDVLAPGVPIYRTPGAWQEDRAVYFSAGIHGDEPAGTEGLVAWAEGNLAWLRRSSCVVVPCFNPEGLLANTRRDADGCDLNREFHHGRHPLIAAWHDRLRGCRFQLGLCLHEDYDATGTYLYELGDGGPGIGSACLDACADFVPRESRPEIEGWPMDRGHLFHGESIEDLLAEMVEGLPEAIWLRAHHAPMVLTFETPSEFSLDLRVAAQVRFIEVALEMSGLG